jgi:lipoprotein-anchoring transpeptidase ErfK/SrfK
MSNMSRTATRALIAGLMLAVAPVASAVGQESAAPQPATAAEPAAAETSPLMPTFEQLGAAAQQIADHMAEADRKARELEEKAAALRPGQFIWQPERADTGEVELVVSLAEQKAYVYRGDTLIGVTTVSTGMRGHRTPTGSFTILQKNRRHFSNLYNNAPMPNMQRLTWDGIALHAGALPGYPASHGCVRLPMEFSRILFDVTRMGGRVHIVAGSPPSAAGALAYATGAGGQDEARERALT